MTSYSLLKSAKAFSLQSLVYGSFIHRSNMCSIITLYIIHYSLDMQNYVDLSTSSTQSDMQSSVQDDDTTVTNARTNVTVYRTTTMPVIMHTVHTYMHTL